MLKLIFLEPSMLSLHQAVEWRATPACARAPVGGGHRWVGALYVSRTNRQWCISPQGNIVVHINRLLALLSLDSTSSAGDDKVPTVRGHAQRRICMRWVHPMQQVPWVDRSLSHGNNCSPIRIKKVAPKAECNPSVAANCYFVMSANFLL